ncbi:MAG: magnesium/cobalt transporter CorA [Thiohalobacterales bacterium]|nr:magnesium/cobalt transporter CorA [Thiohalobacterales bacterium]
MTESKTSITGKAGLPPGSLVHVGEVLEARTRMTVIDYSKENLVEQQFHSVDEVLEYKDTDSVTWIIIEGLADIAIVEQIGAAFDIHQLVLEDILNTHQRPKFEEYDDHLYIVLKSLLAEGEGFAVSSEQISLLVLDNIVITFKEKSEDLLQPVIQRIKASKGRLRSMGTDYLAYAILDTVVDHYFVLMDSLDEVISPLEESLLSFEPTQEMLNTIQLLKRDIIYIRRYVSPTRDLMSGILRSESGLINEKTQIYLRDVLDHVMRVTESIESYRDVLSGLHDIYISSVSNKMNEIMKVLTVFASIFIPLTFLAGIYGMNFEYMPELRWKWAYPVLWLMFITIPLVLLLYFKRKRWL